MGNMLGYDVYSKYPNTVKWRPLFEALNFSARDVGRLHRAFVDISGTGTTVINQDQLLDFLDVDRNKFTKRVFSIFDEDGSGTIDFREFVISLYNYCTLGNSTLALFAFDLYDRDSSGVIDSTEVDMMLRDIYGKRFKKNKHAQRIGDKIASMRNVEFDKDVFREFLRKHPTMLFPAFEIQKKIKKKCLGVGFWKRYTARRVELCNGTYMSVGQLIDALMNTKGPSRSSRLINQYTSSISESFQTPDDSADTRGKTKGKGRKTKDVHYVGATYQRISDEPNSGTAGDTHRRKPTRRQLERQESLDMFARSLGHLAERKSSVGAVDTDTIITTTPSGNQEEVSNSRRRPSFSRAETLSHEGTYYYHVWFMHVSLSW